MEFLKTAEEELTELPKDIQRQILKRIEGLKSDPRPAGAEQLKGPEKLLRVRVGDYRLIYSIEAKRLVVLVIRIGHRREVYENLEVLTHRVLTWRQRKR